MIETTTGVAPFFLVLALILLCNLIAGLARALRGPTPFDRMVAAQFFGTVGVGCLLLVGRGAEIAALRDVALVLALLAPIATIAFVHAHAAARRRRS